MNDKEIIERLIQNEDEILRNYEKEIKNVEFIIKKRVNENNFDLLELILKREILNAKADCYFSLPGHVEVLRGEDE